MTAHPAAAPVLPPQLALDRIESATARFGRLLAGQPTERLNAAVPPCPGWRLSDLAVHLGEIHRWAAHAVLAGTPDTAPPDILPPVLPPDILPTDSIQLSRWYLSCAGHLLAALRATDPGAPAWTFGPAPRTAGFWFRRQLHETQLHLWDAEHACGEATPIDDLTALDGIDELVTMFFPRQVRLGRIPALPHTLAIHPEGPGMPVRNAGRPGACARWVLAGDGIGPPSRPDAPAEATVSGGAEALLLLLWGRIPLADPRFELTGDPASARAVLAAGLTP